MALTNHTGEARRALSVVDVSTLGQSGVVYTAFDDRCGVLRDELPGLEVPPGGAVEGSLCFSVRTEDVESLILYTNFYLTFDPEGLVFFALT